MTAVVSESEDKKNTNLTQQEGTEKSVEKIPEDENSEEMNWIKFRESREEDRRKREHAEKVASDKSFEAEALRKALEALIDKPDVKQIEESEDDRLRKKIDEVFNEREKNYIERRQKQELAEIPQRLVELYPDFDTVCSKENLDWLDFKYPEISESHKDSPESLKKWSNIYKTVKKLMPNSDSSREKSRAEKNVAKPMSISSAGMSEGGDFAPARELTDQMKLENQRRMNKIMKELD